MVGFIPRTNKNCASQILKARYFYKIVLGIQTLYLQLAIIIYKIVINKLI